MNPVTRDIILAIVFFIYPFFLLMVSKGLGGIGFGKDHQRKFVHAAMGLVVFFIPFFTHLWIALIPPIVFTAVNAIDYKYGLFSQIQGEDKGNIGTVLYPISFIILMLVFFGTRWWGLAVIGILSMAFGDALASVFGRALPTKTYTIHGETRSYGGTFMMFTVTFLVTYIVLLSQHQMLEITDVYMSFVAASFIIAAIATCVEALSFNGSDNLTVPVITAFSAWFLLAVMMHGVLGDQSIVNQPLFQ